MSLCFVSYRWSCTMPDPNDATKTVTAGGWGDSVFQLQGSILSAADITAAQTVATDHFNANLGQKFPNASIEVNKFFNLEAPAPSGQALYHVFYRYQGHEDGQPKSDYFTTTIQIDPLQSAEGIQAVRKYIIETELKFLTDATCTILNFQLLPGGSGAAVAQPETTVAPEVTEPVAQPEVSAQPDVTAQPVIADPAVLDQALAYTMDNDTAALFEVTQPQVTELPAQAPEASEPPAAQ